MQAPQVQSLVMELEHTLQLRPSAAKYINMYKKKIPSSNF